MALCSAGPGTLCELQGNRTHSHLPVKQERALLKRWVKFHSCYNNVTLLPRLGYHGLVAELLNLPNSPGFELCFSFLSNICPFSSLALKGLFQAKAAPFANISHCNKLLL